MLISPSFAQFGHLRDKKINNPSKTSLFWKINGENVQKLSKNINYIFKYKQVYLSGAKSENGNIW